MLAIVKHFSMTPIDIYTSYFYQVRYMKPHMVPLSTAVWDPKWFHAGKDQDYTYIDGNGVQLGLKAPMFMPDWHCDGLCHGPRDCQQKGKEKCDFLAAYAAQLHRLDFDKTMRQLAHCGEYFRNKMGFAEKPIIILLFYETPENTCSERIPVQEWFRENGYGIEEFTPTRFE